MRGNRELNQGEIMTSKRQTGLKGKPFRLARNNYQCNMHSRKSKGRDVDGLTYVISDGKYWKIGRSSAGSFQGRLQRLQTANSSELEIVGMFSVNLEKECHYRFYKDKHRGEWFRPNPEIINWLRKSVLFGCDIEKWAKEEAKRTLEAENGGDDGMTFLVDTWASEFVDDKVCQFTLSKSRKPVLFTMSCGHKELRTPRDFTEMKGNVPCKECASANFEAKMSNAESGLATCSKCGITKEVSGFNRDRSSSTGFQSNCKDCKNRRVREKASKSTTH